MSLSSLLSSVVAGSKHSSMTEDLGVAASDGESIDFAALLTEQMNGAAAGAQSVTTDNSPHTVTDARSKQQSTTSFETPPSPDSGGIFSLFETVVAQRNGLPPRTRQGEVESKAVTAASAITTNSTQASIADAGSDPRSASTRSVASLPLSNTPPPPALSESTITPNKGLNLRPSQSQAGSPDRAPTENKAPSLQAEHDDIPSIGSPFAAPPDSVSSRPIPFTNAGSHSFASDTRIESFIPSYSSAATPVQGTDVITRSTPQDIGEAAHKPVADNDRLPARDTAKPITGSVTPEIEIRQAALAQGQFTNRPLNGTSRSNQPPSLTPGQSSTSSNVSIAKDQLSSQVTRVQPGEESAPATFANLTTRASTIQEQAKPNGISATAKAASAPEPAKFADLISMKGSQLPAAEIPVANDEPAKPAGDILPPLPTNTAGPLERSQSSARTDNPHSIATPLNDPRWSQQLGERVVWLARGDIQNAQININPAQLGPIQINISLNGDQMSAHFVAAHQEVRQALEDAMPRLRDMLSGAGINLGQANVGAQTQQQQQRESFAHFGERPRSSGEDAILSPDNHTASNMIGRPVQQGRGLVDLFA